MKDLIFIGSSRDDLLECSDEVKQEVGFSLYLAQEGEKAVNAVPMVGFGSANVLEIISDDPDGTYRAVYTVRYEEALYVLHVFKKKSKRGIATPRRDMELIRRRLREAARLYDEEYGRYNKRTEKRNARQRE